MRGRFASSSKTTLTAPKRREARRVSPRRRAEGVGPKQINLSPLPWRQRPNWHRFLHPDETEYEYSGSEEEEEEASEQEGEPR